MHNHVTIFYEKSNNLPLTIHTEMLKLSILPVFIKRQIEYSIDADSSNPQ